MKRFESRKSPLLIGILIIAALLVAILAVFFSTPETRFSLYFAAFLLVWASWSFSTIHYTVSHSEFRAVFWPFRVKVQAKDVVSVKKGQTPWYVGAGAHYFNRTWWVNTSYGECIIITKKNGRKVGITPKNPARVIRELEQIIEIKKGSSQKN